MNNIYLNYLIKKNYDEANAKADEVCNRTRVNDPERNAALMEAAEAGVIVELYGAQKLCGVTYWNSWD